MTRTKFEIDKFDKITTSTFAKVVSSFVICIYELVFCSMFLIESIYFIQYFFLTLSKVGYYKLVMNICT